MREGKIGVLDSGIGGVTVLRACLQELGSGEYIYYSDHRNNPYGSRSVEELRGIVEEIVIVLKNKGCSIIIVACNTASAMCVDYLREKYQDIKFIAIEPAVKLAYDNQIMGGTLVMATKGTLDSDRFHLLYEKYGREDFYLASCEGLANLIETGQKELIREFLEEHLGRYKNKVKAVVLGCTHYPLIKEEIVDVLGEVEFYDGSNGVARQLRRIVRDSDLELGKAMVTFLKIDDDIRKDKISEDREFLDKKERFFELLEGYDYEQY